ncbi:OLC1v1028187C2 [Oldenlandia corymbosa var. corymbosa]|nr:OLC1v1028187C2 [Oldenlandia corymbosa var. corymbosa]
MLSIGRYPAGQQCYAVILQKPLSTAFIFPARTPQSRVIASFPTHKLAHLGHLKVIGQKRSGLCVYASDGQKQGSHSVLEVEDFDEDGGFWEDDDEEEFSEEIDNDDGDGDEDEEFIPLVNMKQWLAKKPRGFGEGKVYDTSIEDKLMEEIEQSRKAQLANINNLKNNPVGSITKKASSQQEKAGKFATSEVSQQVFRVRLVNLPKKKNIHKDLDSAFKGVAGILQIVPVVSGNKKTRDPICKGLAYIDFKTEPEAHRFIQTFSGQSITFGKVQKQITCEMNISLLKYRNEPSAETVVTAQPEVRRVNNMEQTRSTRFDTEVDQVPEYDEEVLEEDQRPPLSHGGGPVERRNATSIKSPSLKIKKETQEKGIKVPSKTKKERQPKLNIPGSANR